MDIPKEDPEIYQRISERTMRNNPQLRLLEYTRRRKLGKEYADSHLELETNTQVRAEMEKMGGVVYKKCRIFQKRLTRGLGDSGTR